MSSPLSAFTAVPNPQMLAFMGTQSFIMMYQAGEGWQYGKRKQSALSNEEFNKQTPLSIMDRQRQELIDAIPSIKDSMNAMTPLISTIVEQYGDFIKEAINATPTAIENATKDLPFFAYGDTGQTNQKTNASNSDLTLEKLLIQGQNIVLSILKNGIGGPPGPNRNIVETAAEKAAADAIALASIKKDKNVFISADDIPGTQHPGTIIDNPNAPNPASRALNPWTQEQVRKNEIADSGNSPLATAAVKNFKNLIDTTQLKLEEQAVHLQAALASPRYPRFGNQVKLVKTIKANILIHTKKLSALRIKFRSTYGYYY